MGTEVSKSIVVVLASLQGSHGVKWVVVPIQNYPMVIARVIPSVPSGDTEVANSEGRYVIAKFFSHHVYASGMRCLQNGLTWFGATSSNNRDNSDK